MPTLEGKAVCILCVTDLECRQRINFRVIKSDGLEGSAVTVLYNTNSCALESKQLHFTQIWKAFKIFHSSKLLLSCNICML